MFNLGQSDSFRFQIEPFCFRREFFFFLERMVTLEPTAQLKGHKEAVLCLRHAKESFLGNRVLASGSGKQPKKATVEGEYH